MLLPRCTPRREKQGSEPPYKTARSGDIVMVIDGETFCVPEEDVPKVYYEEDDDQVLPTEQVHEGKKIYSNGDDPFAKVKGLISDMIARLEEKASADATHKATSTVCTAQVFVTNMAARYAVYHKTDGLNTIAKRVQGVSQLFASELISPLSSTDLVKAFEAKHINFDEKYYPEDACSLQPTIGASGEYASLLVIRKYQESIGQDLGTKSAHGMNPDSAVMPHISMKIKWFDDCRDVPLDELRRTKQETEDVKVRKQDQRSDHRRDRTGCSEVA